MRIGILLMIVIGTLFLPTTLYADAQKREWFGKWEMNHDGHKGTLVISDSKVDCNTSPWCDMVVAYTGDGQKFAGKIVALDDKYQHMTFVISFPGNSQKFDGYIFSGDKNLIAGITYWGGRTFGFFANKVKLSGSGFNERVSGPRTLQELRKIALRIKPESLLANRMNKPLFSLSGGSFVYSPGDLIDVADKFGYSHESNPYLIPLERIILIDDLRQFIHHNPSSDPGFWEQYFKSAEAIIEQKMLPAISNGGDPKVLDSKLRAYDSELLGMIRKQAPDAFAKAKGLTRQQPTMVVALRHGLPVTFTLNPPGEIYVVAETSYDIAIACGNDVPWRNVSGTNPSLGGYYWIKVVWAGGISKESRILVDLADTEFNFNIDR
jgi:hypothetical protein